MSNPNDSQIIEDAVNAFFSSIQTHLDPKAELDLGGWAGINYDGHPDMKELEEIAGRVLAAHRVAVAESDAELAAAAVTGTGSAAQDAANAAWNKAAAADAAALNKAAPRGAFLSWPMGSGVGGVQIADGQSLADAAAWNKAAAELEAAANAARSLDALVEAAHGLELAESCAREALAAAQDGRPEVDVVAKVKEARRMALAALINLNV